MVAIGAKLALIVMWKFQSVGGIHELLNCFCNWIFAGYSYLPVCVKTIYLYGDYQIYSVGRPLDKQTRSA